MSLEKAKFLIFIIVGSLCLVNLAYAGISLGLNTSFATFIWAALVIIVGWIIAGVVAVRITKFKLTAHENKIKEVKDSVSDLEKDIDNKLYDKGIPLFQTAKGCAEIKKELDKRARDGNRAVCEKVDNLVIAQQKLAVSVGGQTERLNTFIEEEGKRRKEIAEHDILGTLAKNIHELTEKLE